MEENKIIKILTVLIILLFTARGIMAYDDDSYKFEFEIAQTIKEDTYINCNITTDGKIDSYKFNHKDDKQDKTIREDFNDNVTLQCDKKINAIALKIFNYDNKEVYKKFYVKQSKVNYKLNLYHLDLFVKTDKEDDVTCNLYYDDTKREYEISEKESIDIDFLNKMSFSCNETVDTIENIIFEPNYNKSYYEIKHNTNNVKYEVGDISKEYYVSIFLSDKFDKDNKCEITKDKEKKKSYTFNDRIRLADRMLTESFGNSFKFQCENNIESLNVYVFESRTDDLLYNIKFKNASKYIFNKENVIEIKEVAKPKPIVKPIVKPKPVIKPTPKPKPVVKPEVKPVEEIKNKTAINTTIINNTINENNEEDESSYSKSFWIYAIIIWLICVGVLVYLNRDSKKKNDKTDLGW